MKIAGKLARMAQTVPSNEIEVWEENIESVAIFLEMSTQLNVCHGGVVGFNYLSLYPRLDQRYGSDREQWDQAFYDFRIMEGAAVTEMNRKQG